MKKLLITLSISVLSSVFVLAQESVFNVGDKVVNIGIGLGSTYYSGLYYKSTIPPISISYEKGIVGDVLEKGTIGIGAYLGYSGYKWDYFGVGWRYNTIILGARGAFHYPILEKLDTYTGILLGYQLVSSKRFGDSDPEVNYTTRGSQVAWSWFAGGRYYFSDKLAGMLELGYGITYLNLGIAIKLQ